MPDWLLILISVISAWTIIGLILIWLDLRYKKDGSGGVEFHNERTLVFLALPAYPIAILCAICVGVGKLAAGKTKKIISKLPRIPRKHKFKL